MRRGFVGLTFDIQQVRGTEYDQNDLLVAQPDGDGDDPRVGGYELHHPYGFASRAPAAELSPEGEIVRSCSLLVATKGNRTHAWLAGDSRTTALLPPLKLGETVQYGPKGNFVRCHEDGSVSIFTSDDGTVNGKSIYFQVRPDGFTYAAPWGKMTFGPEGFHVLHTSGARIDLGSLSAPAPLNALASYVKIAAAIVQIESTVSAEGTAAGTPEPIAKATSLLSLLTTMQASLTAIGAALTALGNGSAGAAIAASAAALVTAGATVPSTSKQVV